MINIMFISNIYINYVKRTVRRINISFPSLNIKYYIRSSESLGTKKKDKRLKNSEQSILLARPYLLYKNINHV